MKRQMPRTRTENLSSQRIARIQRTCWGNLGAFRRQRCPHIGEYQFYRALRGEPVREDIAEEIARGLNVK